MSDKHFKTFFNWRLPASLETQFRFSMVKAIDQWVHGALIVGSVIIWFLFFMTSYLGVSPAVTYPVFIFIQSVLILAYFSTRTTPSIRLKSIWFTPLYLCGFIWLYMNMVLPAMPVRFQSGFHGTILTLLIVPYVLERLHPIVAIATSVTASITYIVVKSSLILVSPGDYSQFMFQVVSVNLIGAFIAQTQCRRERTRFMFEREAEFEKAENRKLLNRILPEIFVEKLYANSGGETCLADNYPEVTVLFADIVGFTTLTSSLPATKVVSFLESLFSRFDEAATRNGVEKIKTIGDAYMAAAGCPTPSGDHALRVVKFALELIQIVEAFMVETEYDLKIRIGVHSGPVVAGVIGESRFGFDLWGSTVNTAARLEAAGLPGRVHISEETMELLGREIKCSQLQEVELKGIGRIKSCYVAGVQSDKQANKIHLVS